MATSTSSDRSPTPRTSRCCARSPEPAATEAAEATGAPVHVIYKPVRGERPLWDFPDGTLAGREVATFVVSRAGGWDVVPPTVLRRRCAGSGFGPAVDRRPVLALGQRPAGRHLRAAQGAGRVALGHRRRGERRAGGERHPREPGRRPRRSRTRRRDQQRGPQGLAPPARPGRLAVGVRPRRDVQPRS